jgi:hypothetical protein
VDFVLDKTGLGFNIGEKITVGVIFLILHLDESFPTAGDLRAKVGDSQLVWGVLDIENYSQIKGIPFA